LFFRIVDVERDTDLYMEALFAPMAAVSELSLFEITFGLGRTKVVSEYADFGIGMLVHQTGIFFVGILACALIVILVNALTEIRIVMNLKRRLTQTEQKWLWLATVNGLISFIFAMGLFHYTPSIELGGLQMFSFSLALTVVATRMLRIVRYAGQTVVRVGGHQGSDSVSIIHPLLKPLPDPIPLKIQSPISGSGRSFFPVPKNVAACSNTLSR